MSRRHVRTASTAWKWPVSLATGVPRADSPHAGGRKPTLDKRAARADNGCMRHVPTSLKLLAAFSLLAEATAAALVFWHTGPRTR